MVTRWRRLGRAFKPSRGGSHAAGLPDEAFPLGFSPRPRGLHAELPAAWEPPLLVCKHNLASLEGSVSAKERCSVLVVEDDASIAEFVVSVLEDEGYAVRATDNGEEALALVGREPPDVILLDLVLPGISGEALLRELRAADAHMPVILMTAAREAAPGGPVAAEGLLQKPFELASLLDEVERVLGERVCEA